MSSPVSPYTQNFVTVLNEFANMDLVITDSRLCIYRGGEEFLVLESDVRGYKENDIDSAIIEVSLRSYLIVVLLREYFMNNEDKLIIIEMFSINYGGCIILNEKRFTSIDSFIRFIGQEYREDYIYIKRTDDQINVFVLDQLVGSIILDCIESFIITSLSEYIIFGCNSNYTRIKQDRTHQISNLYN
jgi:hypothetical protein